MRNGLRLWVTIAALAAAAGCARREAPPAPPPPRPVQRPPVVIRPLFPADYVAAAASNDLLAIRSAELALRRASSEQLRAYAQRLIDDHRGTSAQLSFGGRRLNLVPPAVLRAEHQAMLDQLGEAGEFDATFKRQQVAAHEAAVRLHDAFARRGESPTLRSVAAYAAPIERRHLDELRRMR